MKPGAIAGFFRERLGTREPSTVPGTGSFAFALGWTLALLLVVEAVTGAALSAFYAPSTTDAWASVAYIQDRSTWGWLVRGMHYHAASVIVVIAGLHLLQTALYGAYKKPRELTWWLGLALLGVVVALAITGFVLRWDQAAFYGHKVEVGIAAGTPIVGESIRGLALGGNDSGNLTLTRFHMLHVVALPGLVALLTALHIKLARRHGSTPYRAVATTSPRFPAQTIRDVLAMALAISAVLALAIAQHGVDLGPPADPATAYDARPLWFMRWLFQLRHLAGSAEELAALAAPAIVGGILVGLPLLDRGEDRSIRKRIPYVGAVVGIGAVIAAFTLMSIMADDNPKRDAELAKVEKQAARARDLARKYGVPSTGPLDVYAAAPMHRARTIFEAQCKGCHDAGSPKRKGPVIAVGHHGRDWFRAFLAAPSGPAFYGKTKIGNSENAMAAVELPKPDMDDLVEALYAETGAADVDAAKVGRGQAIFEKACTDCHARSEGTPGTSAPGLAGIGSRAYYTSYIGNPKSAVHMGTESEMPRFDRELSIVDRDALAAYLVWLRSATNADVGRLDPL